MRRTQAGLGACAGEVAEVFEGDVRGRIVAAAEAVFAERAAAVRQRPLYGLMEPAARGEASS
jgi:hypothetical protein